MDTIHLIWCCAGFCVGWSAALLLVLWRTERRR